MHLLDREQRMFSYYVEASVFLKIEFLDIKFLIGKKYYFLDYI